MTIPIHLELVKPNPFYFYRESQKRELIRDACHSLLSHSAASVVEILPVEKFREHQAGGGHEKDEAESCFQRVLVNKRQ